MLGMSWGYDRQRIFSNEDAFTHEGPINTDPSHDCAHLLIAANGEMLWKPGGEKDLVRIAEYNASVLEHLLDETFNCCCYAAPPGDFPSKVLKYANWFVEEHFKPFPMSAKEALETFCFKLDRQLIVRLSPHFFNMKRRERRDARGFRSER